MILELKQPRPMSTSRGEGMAIFLMDLGMDTNSLWGVVLNRGGEFWWIPNPQVRFASNWSFGRVKLKPVV